MILFISDNEFCGLLCVRKLVILKNIVFKQGVFMISSVLAPINKDGWKFIGLFATVSFLLYLFSTTLGVVGVLLTAWCVYFFRDPERITPIEEGLVISPADGIVSLISQAALPKELGLEDDSIYTRVSIFLNVFDVHVNRVPIDGTVIKSVYKPGKFLNASLDKASEQNERQSIALKTNSGKTMAFVQIAGLVARRILCDLQKDQQVLAGERFGLIRFGSRVDVYLPQGVNPLVVLGQRMIAGETVIADINSSSDSRRGEQRQ
jgi:phosphatidylserine decarboxylase